MRFGQGRGGELVERLALVALGAASIGPLLLYFYGVAAFRTTILILLLPAEIILASLGWWLKRRQRTVAYQRLLAGIWAGGLATLTYDLCRLPVAWSGVPVFKAISYFGTVSVGRESPSIVSEVLGWGYHFSNGVGFGLMYAAFVSVPRWWTAIAWGLVLEGIMLLTPYAEVFGYRLSPQFLSITIGAHVVYGATLWGALRCWLKDRRFGDAPPLMPRTLVLGFAAAPLGIAGVAYGFHAQHAAALPPSPPPYVGPHLYVTWNVPEADRVAALWVLHRFVDTDAELYFVAPFSVVGYGQPFDLPEANVRRGAEQSATEVLLERAGLTADSRLQELAAMTHLVELVPWQLVGSPEAFALAQLLQNETASCGNVLHPACLGSVFAFLDRWYEQAP